MYAHSTLRIDDRDMLMSMICPNQLGRKQYVHILGSNAGNDDEYIFGVSYQWKRETLRE